MSLGERVGEKLGLAGVILACQFMAPWMWLGIPRFYHHLKVVKIIEDPPYEGWPSCTMVKCVYMGGHRLELTIDKQDNHMIYLTDYGQHYGGSGDIGVLFFGIPGTIIASPLIILAMIIHSLTKLISGKSVEDLIIWKKLKNQLPKEVADRLDTALSTRGFSAT